MSYGELCTRFYDLDKPHAPELALEWFSARLPQGRILEPMCGSGRFLLPLLQQGRSVDGLDASEAMLRACSARLAAAGIAHASPWRAEDYARCRLWLQGLDSLALPVTDYAAAFIPSSSFCLLADPAPALRRLAAHLAPGGLLLLEFEPPHEAPAPPAETTRTVHKGAEQIRLVMRHEYDAQARVEHYFNQYELKRSGRVVQTETETLRLQCYSPQELRALLEANGFADAGIEHAGFGWCASATRYMLV
ncbi:MAG: class I SAM-dependent methyltransferase [Planctomycetes bacterium]|nr:class I SAM-dependent methyltransferase [Planctomycetota bacterium]MCW8135440.1 class I SAM-dependent methyltransferase [Planctomycetota bacterium]